MPEPVITIMLPNEIIKPPWLTQQRGQIEIKYIANVLKRDGNIK
jgi:hypothetical protein